MVETMRNAGERVLFAEEPKNLSLKVNLFRGGPTKPGSDECFWVVFLSLFESNRDTYVSNLEAEFSFADEDSKKSGASLLEIGAFRKQTGRDLPSLYAATDEVSDEHRFRVDSREDGVFKTKNSEDDSVDDSDSSEERPRRDRHRVIVEERPRRDRHLDLEEDRLRRDRPRTVVEERPRRDRHRDIEEDRLRRDRHLDLEEDRLRRDRPRIVVEERPRRDRHRDIEEDRLRRDRYLDLEEDRLRRDRPRIVVEERPRRDIRRDRHFDPEVDRFIRDRYPVVVEERSRRDRPYIVVEERSRRRRYHTFEDERTRRRRYRRFEDERLRWDRYRAPEEESVPYLKLTSNGARAAIMIRKEGGVALMLRCQRCSMTISVDFKERSVFGSPPHLRKSHFNIIIDSKVGSDSAQVSNPTALGWVAGSGWVTGLKKLLEATNDGETLNDVDVNGRSALSWAMGNGQIETAELLIHRTDIDKADNHKRTALSRAAEGGRDQAVDKLLVAGAKRTLDENNRSPLWWAAASGHTATINKFLQGEADPHLDQPDKSGDTPLDKAARGGQTAAIRALVQARIKRDTDNEPTHSSTFVPDYLQKAVKEGWTALLKTFVDINVIVDPANEYRIPLCLATQYGRKESVEVLLSAGAKPDSEDDNGHSALCLAISKNHEAIVEILSSLGADPRKRDGSRDTPWDLAEKAANRSLLTILAAAAEEGKLAESEKGYTHPSTDDKFTATVFSFNVKPNGTEFSAAPKSVKELLKAPKDSLTKEQQTFRWIHLPANNMRWVELLMIRLYDNQNRAYQILKPERWVRRQHRGASEQPHARFMRPLSEAFMSASTGSTSGSKDLADATTSRRSDIVLFMPFLHWDINGLRLQRRLGSNDIPTVDPETKEVTTESYSSGKIAARDLMSQYYNDDHHSLHMRRTLDQYYYHTLPDTEARDESQVLTRYQETRNSFLRAITMVDQLWLWVLKGPEGKSDTIITCFPPVEKLDEALQEEHPDPYDDTDVLEGIKRFLRTETSSIRSARDLVGVIVALCSRNYLNPATTVALNKRNRGVQFSDVYETAIGELMQSEAQSFEEFKGLSNNSIAEIKKEITSLWEIKDVIDELNIMAVLFQDQKRVFTALDSLVWAIDIDEHFHLESRELNESNESNEQEQKVEGSGEAGQNPGAETFSEDGLDDAMATSSTPKDDKPSPKIEISADAKIEINFNANAKIESGFHGIHHEISTVSIWRHRDEGRAPSLPIEYVNASIDDIRGMMDRANTVQRALNTLVDLKYKHNNVIDSQKSLEMTTQTAELTAQIKRSEDQSVKLAGKTAELTIRINQSTEATRESVGETERLTKETTELAKKADKEGRTVMVFTIVTIIFLPLSFLATMFQLPIQQYKRKDDKLDLGYVSAIMFPISTLVSAILIWVAFRADVVERFFKGKKKKNEKNESNAA